MNKKTTVVLLITLFAISFYRPALAATVGNKNITLSLSGGSAIQSVIISNHSDFSDSKTFSNNTTASWNLCYGLSSCENGDYTVYLRYIDTDGAAVLDLTKKYTLDVPLPIIKKEEVTTAAEVLTETQNIPEVVIPEPAPVLVPVKIAPISFTDKTKEILLSPQAQETLQNTATTFAVTQAVATPFLAFAPSLSGSSLVVLPLRIWNFLLVVLGIRKRRKSWGIVYDSLSKQPLDPVVVTLKNEKGEEISTSITDMDGRYGFFVEGGNYTLSAGKGNYIFPSSIMGDQTYDPMYDNLYYGETLELSRDSVITKNIPMDPVGTDWNQAEKVRTKRGYTTQFIQFIARATNILFFLGFVTSMISLALHQTVINIVLLSVYVLLGIIRRAGFAPRIYGIIKIEDKPLGSAILRFWNESGIQISKAVTDNEGRYYALVPTGKYRMSVEIPDEIGGVKPYVSGIEIEAKAGVINQEIELPEI